jgi:isocitrate dehydrogenase
MQNINKFGQKLIKFRLHMCMFRHNCEDEYESKSITTWKSMKKDVTEFHGKDMVSKSHPFYNLRARPYLF